MNECTHYYKEYNQVHLPPNRIEMKCSTYKGCGKVLNTGYVFRPSDYHGNSLTILTDRRYVWDDGTVTIW